MLMSFKLSSDSVLKVSNALKDIGKHVAVGASGSSPEALAKIQMDIRVRQISARSRMGEWKFARIPFSTIYNDFPEG